MTLIRRTGSLIALALSLGCSSDSILSTSGLRFAFAQGTCGPADGPAVAIYLTSDPSNAPTAVAPYARIYIDLSNAVLDGRQLSVAGDHAQAGATFNSTDSNYEIAKSGYVAASHSANNEEIVGIADITFAGAGHLIRAFHAHLFPNTALCP